MNKLIPLVRYMIGALAICAADLLAGRDITLWVAYAAPIGLASWNLGRSAGYAIGLFCIVLQLATWLHDLRPHPGVLAVIVLSSRFMVFLLVILLVSALRSKESSRIFQPTKTD